MTRNILIGLTYLVSPVLIAAPDIGEARSLYERAEFQSSLRLLVPLPGKQGSEFLLIGQNYYMLEDYVKAQEALSKAIGLEPANSMYHLWLGRTMGRRAETSSPFTAPRHASKARQSFEKAVELDSKNIEALADLFEYYLNAPGFLGGGIEKAAALSIRIAALNPAEGAYARYRLADTGKQYVEAEKEVRLASQLAPEDVGRKIDVAKFLARRGRLQESDTILESAEKTAPGNPRLLIEHARIYIDTHRRLEAARQMLREYMLASLTPDDPPRREAEELLRKISRT